MSTFLSKPYKKIKLKFINLKENDLDGKRILYSFRYSAG